MIEEKFTVHDIAQALGVSTQTVKRWVWWVEEEEPDLEWKIPHYEVVRGVRLWTASVDTIEHFKRFREHIPKGAMAEYNALHSWGKRGQRIAERKNV